MRLRFILGCSLALSVAWAMPFASDDRPIQLDNSEETPSNGIAKQEGSGFLGNRTTSENRAGKVIRLDGTNRSLGQDPDPSKSIRVENRDDQLSFEALEAKNANRYNTLIDERASTTGANGYSFEELEAMNANRYNPLIDVEKRHR